MPCLGRRMTSARRGMSSGRVVQESVNARNTEEITTFSSIIANLIERTCSFKRSLCARHFASIKTSVADP
jgi:hypothetical protein